MLKAWGINMAKNKPWEDMDKLGKLVNSYTSTRIENASKEQMIRFSKMPHEVIDELIKVGYADPEDRQNWAPSLQELNTFMRSWTSLEGHEGAEITGHGYIIMPPRDDARVTLEGIAGKGLSVLGMQDAIAELRHADDFEFNIEDGVFYSWWD